MFLVTAKVNPDLDGIACAYAYSDLLRQNGTESVGGIFGKPHVEARYLIERFKIKDISYDPSKDWNSFILVDMSDVVGLPPVVKAKEVVEVIDHRKGFEPEKLFPAAKIQNEMVGAAATLIAEKYYRSPATISETSALLLYCAIFSNTLNLKSPVTTKRDLTAVRWLKGRARVPSGLIHDMFFAKTAASIQDLQEVLVESDFKRWVLGKTSLGITQLEALNIQDIVSKQYEEIIKILDNLKRSQKLSFAFLTAVDLEKGFNLFVCPHPLGQKVLSKVLGITFTKNVSKRPGFMLRKEIIPLLKEQLSKT